MSEDIHQLKAELCEANQVLKEASGKASDVQKRLAAAIAEELGVKIGSVVVVTKKIGYGTKRRIQDSRYRVISISYKGYGSPPIGLRGTTIRKDGTNGEAHEIWQDWTLEKAGEI